MFIFNSFNGFSLDLEKDKKIKEHVMALSNVMFMTGFGKVM